SALPSLSIESVGDGAPALSCVPQLRNALDQRAVVAELIEAPHWAIHRAHRFVSSHPVDLGFELLAGAAHGHDDVLDKLSNYYLTVHRRGGGSIPDRGQVSREVSNGLALRCIQDRGLLR